MKHVAVLASALLATLLFLAIMPSSSATWLTYREDVAVNSGTVDIDNISYHNGTTTTTYRNVTLPCTIAQLNRTVTQFRIKNENAGNLTFNLTVNGVAVNSSSAVNWSMGNWSNVTLSMMTNAGVSTSNTYLNFTFNVSNANNDIHIRIYTDDASVTRTWLNSSIVIKEKDVTTPTIGTTQGKSFWTVNDSINITNTLGYTISDVNLTPTFPSHKISAPATYYNVGTLTNGSSAVRYAQYQKYGPYVFKIIDDSDGTSHEVTIYVKSNELLTNCVDWSIITNNPDYDGVFDTINYDTLEVEFNGQSEDWEQGSIELEDLTIKTSYSNNKFVFTWTEAIPVSIPSAVQPWYLITFFGIALYLWAIIIIAIVAVVSIVIILRKA